ncbi:DJ-1/PfpI family protein [Bradyrhizobium sediminis]|uniref:DJ-1/PfpI family protein n=1 Tax=Bradyrhizobium sediminis TaxID=2840469 RepID=A0A975P175_9BRAD|nr:DJ-1/PfpI family protein [Bradyrhizobium sediminis]QWG24536.1 DJ-1/PfpI family protein [Bradyrhizobium sediminis]
MLVYPGMTLLDLVGPLQTWARLPNAELQFAWKAPGDIPTDAGLSVNATVGFSNAWEDPDILFAPGGLDPTFALLDDDETIHFLASRGEKAKWVTSVCTGAVLLGAAGLLKGYRAATHWFFLDQLELYGATPSDARYVVDRNRATGGGVTAGVDFGLVMATRIAGEPFARSVQLAMQYAPEPPFRSGTPAEALPETAAAVRARFEANGRAQALRDACIRTAARMK